MTAAENYQLGAPAAPSSVERFGRVPDPVLEDLELVDGDVRVYAYLARWGNWSTGESDEARSSHRRIAEGTGRSVSSVKRSLRRLAERGHVEVIPTASVYGDRAANRYRLVALDPRQPILRPVPSPVGEFSEVAGPPERGGGVSRDPTPVQGWPSKESEFFSEQDTPPTPPVGEVTSPGVESGPEGGEEDQLDLQTEVAARDLRGDEVLAWFRRVVPEPRRCVFDRQAAGPGGQRLVAAAGVWVAAGGSLEAVVEEATRGPLPELVHNWPAFLAARVEALEPPRRVVVVIEDDDHDHGEGLAVVVQEGGQQAADEAAAAGHAAVVAESAAVSAALSDDLLAAVVGRVADSLPGPLGRSPFAISRAVIGFGRAAYAARPGDLEAAVFAALADGESFSAEPEGGPTVVPLPAPPSGTAGLQDRVRELLGRSSGAV
jgi:hypothetical protein